MNRPQTIQFGQVMRNQQVFVNSYASTAHTSNSLSNTQISFAPNSGFIYTVATFPQVVAPILQE